MSKYILITAIIASLCHGCPMGLGKNYHNKPTFFHNDFYTYNTPKTEDTPNNSSQVLAQKETEAVRRSS